jgi:hypothetical protein
VCLCDCDERKFKSRRCDGEAWILVRRRVKFAAPTMRSSLKGKWTGIKMQTDYRACFWAFCALQVCEKESDEFSRFQVRERVFGAMSGRVEE